MRGHDAVTIDEFMGLWKRGDAESCPSNHFSDCQNVQYIQSGFETRDGIDIYPPGVGLHNVVRIYTFVYNSIESILILDNLGNIYDTGSPTPTTPILTIAAMIDFAFAQYANRAYISPNDGNTGLQGESLYVYKGNGVPARKAGGAKPTGPAMNAVLSATPGNCEPGHHIFGVAYETDTGFITAIGPDALTDYTVNTPAEAIDLSGIPISPDAFVVARHIVGSKSILIPDYSGNPADYELFFIPNGRIADNTTTTLTVSFFDSELLDSASGLADLYENPPAGVALTVYHNRLVSVGEFGQFNTDPDLNTVNNPSIARVSNAGEPEAFDQVSGLITAPLEGTNLSNAQEYRDILYLFKPTRTYAYTDNGDDPSSWPLSIIDQGVGAPCHGVATVLDSGGINIEYIIVCDYSGVMIFNGTYQRPELSWKIEDFWLNLDRNFFKNIQIMNDSILKHLYITLPNNQLLFGNYSLGLDPEKIRWAPWKFVIQTNTITLIEFNKLIFGSTAVLGP